MNLRTVDVPNLLKGIKAATTTETYTMHWHSYVEFAGERNMADAATFLAWRHHMIHNTTNSASYINLRLNSVKAVFRELAERHLIQKEMFWPIQDVKSLKPNALPERRKHDFRVKIEPADMRGLINTPEVNLGAPLAARNRALLLVLATSALRISEARHIKVADVQKVGQNYRIANILGKGASESRIAPLSEEAYLAIQDWLLLRPLQSPWLFFNFTFDSTGGLLYTDQPMSRSAAYHTVKGIAAQYGLPGIKPHDFRRFVGTQLAKEDIRKAQRVLGHKSIETTARHYVMDEVPLGSTEGLF